MTSRSAIQGFFCSACAEKKAYRATTVTWMLGWWGFPLGPIYSIHAIFTNMFGGEQPAKINANSAAYQAWVFATRGKNDVARAVALDAITLSKKINPEGLYAKIKKALGYEVSDEGAELRSQIQSFLNGLGETNSVRLKDAWRLMRRPFFVQASIAAFVFGTIGFTVQSSPSSPSNTNNYASKKESNPLLRKEPRGYERPATAPNGQVWPATAGYIRGFERLHTNGFSQVTVDNSKNDSDVFVKLVTLDSPRALPVRTFFIPSHGSFTLENVTAGNYDIRYRDLSTGSLSRSEPFHLEETHTYEGTQYSTVTMTLYKVRHGNMQTYQLSEDEF